MVKKFGEEAKVALRNVRRDANDHLKKLEKESKLTEDELKEAEKEQPHAILGMFDVSARPMVENEILTLAMPYSIFLKLLESVQGSFLGTESWKKVLNRIRK